MKELRAVWRGYVNPACLNTASLRGTACPEFTSGKQSRTVQRGYANPACLITTSLRGTKQSRTVQRRHETLPASPPRHCEVRSNRELYREFAKSRVRHAFAGAAYSWRLGCILAPAEDVRSDRNLFTIFTEKVKLIGCFVNSDIILNLICLKLNTLNTKMIKLTT